MNVSRRPIACLLSAALGLYLAAPPVGASAQEQGRAESPEKKWSFEARAKP